MRILGISCFYHDSAACLVEDGRITAACQEERFTRVKHDSGFPGRSISWCLEQAGISSREVDYTVFYDKPFVKFDRILETYMRSAPWGLRQFLESLPVWMREKLWIKPLIQQELGADKLLFCEHHRSHAASAFYPSPFDDAAVVTVDGAGEWDTAAIWVGEGNSLRQLKSLKFPHSLGLLYSAFTYYCGFRVNSGEYKLMGLAPYGSPVYADLILKELIDLKEDGSFRMNMKYFGYCSGLTMTNRAFDRLFGGPARKPESAILKRHMDIASSIQAVTETIMLRVAAEAARITGKDRLCMAGGVALNCVANGKILQQGIFRDIWVQPASGDAGGALGAALATWHEYLGNTRQKRDGRDSQRGSLLGPCFDNKTIETELERLGAVYERLEHGNVAQTAAELIASGAVVGWFQGGMEFGPRALGNRSILGDPRDPGMQSRMNLKIKFRESFRPFAPSILAEHAREWFGIDKSPYMLITAPIAESKRVAGERKDSGLDAVREIRSLIPAVTHVDYSCRVQTVEKGTNSLFYEVLAAFHRLTGCPAVINTSFNVRGEPIVCTPGDAYRCFSRTDIDYLMIGDFLLAKNRQKAGKQNDEWKKYLVPD